MNFFFGQTHNLSVEQASQNQSVWLAKTIFSEYPDRISTHIEEDFSLTLINDPNNLCPYQSKSIYVDNDFICATDCQLFNKEELAKKLRIDATAENEIFFISAYLKWGNEFPDKFDGKFSFIIWDRKNKFLLAGLDALGYGSFTYSKVGDDFYFSSDLATLLDQPRVDKSINMKRFYQCFRYSNNGSEQTYFQHCHYCPPSHVFRVENNKIEAIDYWKLTDIAPPKTNKDEATYTQEFISLLRNALKKEIQDDKNLGLMLSGGYDSSLLAAILAENPDWRSNLTCYSYIFEKFKLCDESDFIEQTLKQLKLKGKMINCDDKTILSDLDKRHLSKDVINLDSYSSLPETIYYNTYEDRNSILISGMNGDDLFTGHIYLYRDLLLTKQFSVILLKLLSSPKITKEIYRFLNFGLRPLAPKSLKHIYRKLNRIRPTVNEFGITQQQVNSIDQKTLLKQNNLFHHQNLLKLLFFRNKAESIYYLRKKLYLKYNCKYVMPYYNKNIIEFIWILPLQHLEKLGKIRWLQRQSLKVYNLNHIINRADKTSFSELIHAGIIENKARIKKIINQSLILKNSLLEESKIEIFFRNIGQKEVDWWSLRIFVLAELWYREIHRKNKSFNSPNLNRDQ